MRLRNPGQIEQAIATIRDVVAIQLGQVAGEDASGRIQAFCNWCEDIAKPQFKNIFPPEEPIHAELAESFWRLLTVQPTLMTPRRYNGIATDAIRTWTERLDQVQEELRGQQLFAARPGIPLLLDTSVLMEGQPFLEFDWCSLDQELAGERVRLIVPIVVVGELDDLLHDRDADRRKKARDATRMLWELHGAKPTRAVMLPGKSQFSVEVLVTAPDHQPMSDNDAEIIDQTATVHEITGLAMLATCDLRMVYRAAAVGVTSVRMPRRDDDLP
jgi:hypothetical protein